VAEKKKKIPPKAEEKKGAKPVPPMAEKINSRNAGENKGLGLAIIYCCWLHYPMGAAASLTVTDAFDGFRE